MSISAFLSKDSLSDFMAGMWSLVGRLLMMRVEFFVIKGMSCV